MSALNELAADEGGKFLRCTVTPSMRLLDTVLSINACSRSVFRRCGA